VVFYSSAGSDTTASSVAAIVHLVKTHPEVYKKLIHELEGHIGCNEIPQHHQVKDLPYLQAVVDEGYVSSVNAER
jgi:cytochrome P450